jgi:hypothetical protein
MEEVVRNSSVIKQLPTNRFWLPLHLLIFHIFIVVVKPSTLLHDVENNFSAKADGDTLRVVQCQKQDRI